MDDFIRKTSPEKVKPEILDFSKFKSLIDGNIKVFTYEQIDSTNIQARSYLKDNPTEKCVFVAKEQLQGKGRHGKSFFSPEHGLYISFVYPISKEIEIDKITTQVAVCVCKTIEKITDLQPQIKWVNDIFINNKKVSGILCEAVNGKDLKTPTSVTIGIGINFKSDVNSFPDELKNVAAPLFTDECQCSVTDLAINLTNNIFNNLTTYTMKEYRERSFLTGKEITFEKNGIAHTAQVIGIDDNARLEILENGEKAVLSSGEISVKFKR